MKILARILLLLGIDRRDVLDVADKLTEEVVDLFAAAHSALDKANGLYVKAVEELDQEVIDLYAAAAMAEEDRASVIGAVQANERRKAKLAEFIG